MAARGEPAGFIFTIDCTLRASAQHLASAGCRVAARGEPAVAAAAEAAACLHAVWLSLANHHRSGRN